MLTWSWILNQACCDIDQCMPFLMECEVILNMKSMLFCNYQIAYHTDDYSSNKFHFNFNQNTGIIIIKMSLLNTFMGERGKRTPETFYCFCTNATILNFKKNVIYKSCFGSWLFKICISKSFSFMLMTQLMFSRFTYFISLLRMYFSAYHPTPHTISNTNLHDSQISNGSSSYLSLSHLSHAQYICLTLSRAKWNVPS